MNKDTLDLTYNEVSDFAAQKIAEGRAAFEVAAALVTIGISIYKTTLSAADFNSMMDTVSESRDKITKLTDAVTLQ